MTNRDKYKALHHDDLMDRIVELEGQLEAVGAGGVGRMAVTTSDDERAALEKWMIVDGDMRATGGGLITYHAAAFQEGVSLTTPREVAPPVVLDIRWPDEDKVSGR